MILRILESAKRDLINGFSFYEQQAPALGDYFLDSIFSDVDSLVIYSGIHPLFFERYHCMFSKRFPFAIYYRIENDTILIQAILDCRQNPDTIEKRFDR